MTEPARSIVPLPATAVATAVARPAACVHCWPQKRRSHLLLHIDYYINLLLVEWMAALLPSVNRSNSPRSSKAYDVLAGIGVIRFHANPDESKLFNRSLTFMREAKRRGLDVKAVTCLGRYVNEFRLTYNGKNYDFEGTPLNLWESNKRMDEKQEVKLLLKRHNVPVPEGRHSHGIQDAVAYAETIGYPLAVKPVSGSLSQHVTAPVRTKEELQEAVRIAKQYQPAFMVERFVEGDLYRATVVGKKHVFVCRKERANVIGDGVSAVRELINRKNADERRGRTDAHHTTLHAIPVDAALEEQLALQSLCLDSVPDPDRRVVLHKKFILSQGCDIIACTKSVHPHNWNLFLHIANVLDADLVGIDFICRDIAASYHDQPCGVLETNSLPFLDMHEHPSHGEPDPVARLSWDLVLQRLDVLHADAQTRGRADEKVQ
jgi:D-alanine-D-alanine ligase-like ATP-grasp enzyme